MDSPRALPAPAGAVVVLSDEHVEMALAASRESSRRRTILPFHKAPEERLHRMFNALQPGTYVQPHNHASTGKNEIFVMLRGALDFIVFEPEGGIELVTHLRAGGAEFGIDVAPDRYHSFLVREPDTLVYEVKTGPYVQADDKDFAAWAPREGTPGVDAYVEALERELLSHASPALRR
jgi:cupin fold WbuC family metalloprotein